jgi:hypothetical protein
MECVYVCMHRQRAVCVYVCARARVHSREEYNLLHDNICCFRLSYPIKRRVATRVLSHMRGLTLSPPRSLSLCCLVTRPDHAYHAVPSSSSGTDRA